MAEGQIRIRVPWKRQPPAGTKINAAHTLASRVEGVALFHPRDPVIGPKNNRWDFGGSQTLSDFQYISEIGAWAVDQTGVSGTATDYFIAQKSSFADTSFGNGWGIFWYAKYRSSIGLSTHVGKFFDGSGDGRSWNINSDSGAGEDNEIQVFIANAAGTAFQINGLLTTTDILENDVWHFYGVVWDRAAGNVRVYRDGVLDSTLGSGATAAMKGNDIDMWIGGGQGLSNDGTPDRLCGPHFFFNGTLTDGEAMSFSNDTWNLFQPRTQYIPVGVADVVGGRIMSSLAYHGGLAGKGGIAGAAGGLAG